MTGSFKDLTVYQKAFDQAMRIFEVTKKFPRSEQFSLVDQIRRSSRSVCANLAESWRKRRYIAHFVSKLTDADAEASETTVWLDFSLKCVYLDDKVHRELSAQYDEIGRMLGSMIASPEKFCTEYQRGSADCPVQFAFCLSNLKGCTLLTANCLSVIVAAARC